MRIFTALCISMLVCVCVASQDRISRADRAKMRETRETMRGLHLDLTTYHQLNGQYPDDLKALVSSNLREVLPKDAWEKDFTYTREDRDFKLTSLGADGKPGGKLANVDIVWTEAGEYREMTADERAERERRLEEQRFETTKLLARRRMVVIAGEVVNKRRTSGAWPKQLEDCRRDGETDADKVVNLCFADPFGHAFTLRLLPHENFAVVCWGADGKEGGAGRDTDFVVTEREVRKEYADYRDYWGYNPWNGDWRVENLANDVKRYKERFGTLPNELADLTRAGNGPNGPIQAIRNSIPQDDWGNDYVLITLGDEEFYVGGLGKDQLEGGVKDNADVIFPRPGAVAEEMDEWEEPMPAQNDDEILYEVAQALMDDIISRANEYHAANDSYPATLEDIADKFPEKAVPLDPWEAPFIYALTMDADGKVTGFTLTCHASDSAEGGDSWAADIVLNQDYEQQ
ncbi:MAG: type II secretion system protein GspG [Planctomycetes bacterium]|nr:type II secretion system protein GspG [Planctomycetota bacterium]